MLNLDALEEKAKTSQTVSVSGQWMLSLIREMRGDRARIATLEAENARLRASQGTTTTKIIRDGVEVKDVEFPHREFDEAMGFMDKAFASIDRMFGKLGKNR